MKKTLKHLSLSLICILLCSCNAILDKDNTPPPSKLVTFQPEVTPQQLWASHTSWGSESDYLQLVPAVNDQYAFSASHNGTVTAIDKVTGKAIWSNTTASEITAGPAASDQIVVVGHRNAKISALSAADGRLLWRAKVSSEILAAPAIKHGTVLVKSIDGHLQAFSASDGHKLWAYQQVEPNLILRRASTPLINNDGTALVGFSNGNLAKITLSEGSLIWQQPLAMAKGIFAIQRMIDVDADPIVYNQRIYAASYQGRIASLEYSSGRILWSHDLSSYTGMTADNNKVYISDAQGHVWAFDRQTGTVLWRQTKLAARNITAPVAMGNNTIVVGDGEGYLHWLNRDDGHFVARMMVDSSGIIANPILDNNTLYVVTKAGNISATRIAR